MRKYLSERNSPCFQGSFSLCRVNGSIWVVADEIAKEFVFPPMVDERNINLAKEFWR